MTEAELTSKLLEYLKPRLPGVYLKHADRATAGLPDLSVTRAGRTTWLEVKLLKYRSRPSEVHLSSADFHEPQLTVLERLAHHGHAYYLVFASSQRAWSLAILNPVTVRGIVRDPTVKLALSWKGKELERIVTLLLPEVKL